MIDPELNMLYKNIQEAVKSEDLFGVPERISLEDKDKLTGIIKDIYHRFARIAHPDKYSDEDNKEVATDAFSTLNELYNFALDKIQNGTYGKGFSDDSVNEDNEILIETEKRQYYIKSTLAQGDLSTVYGGECSGTEENEGKIAIKVIEDPADNDLMQNEARILKLLHQEATKFSRHLPVLLDRFKTSDGQAGIIMKRIAGYDLYTIREKYKKGIPSHHIIWIFRRVLSVLGFAHSKGIIHGNIDPSHIMVRPHDHNVFLVDWCYSIYKPAITGQGFKALNEDYSPPEVAQTKPPIPASDLYSLGKCMLYLLGGDPKNESMPDSVDQRIQRFIKFFLRKSPIQRPQDAWEMYLKLDALREEVFGPHQFRVFEM
ncbi:MAG: protein kinase [bacterium]|nr:protein kinase [bacterium]